MGRITRSHVAEDRPLAERVGGRIRRARLAAGLTQAAVAGDRYTKAYVSALEGGKVKPSLAALNFLAGRLGLTLTALLGDEEPVWARLEADLHLASGDWRAAADAYEELLPSATGTVRGEVLLGLAEALCRLESSTEALRAAGEAEHLFAAAGRPQEGAWATYWRAFALYQLEESSEARRLLERIESLLAVEVADPDLRIRVAIALAMVESRDDEPERALAHLEAARGVSLELDDRRRATFLFSLALSYRETGDYEGAARAGQQSLALFRSASADFEAASIENELALAYLGLGNTAAAEIHAREAETMFEGLGNRRWVAHVRETIAQIMLARGDVDAAVDLAQQASREAASAGNAKAEVSALLTLGRAHRAGGSMFEALEALSAAADIARATARRAQLQMALGELAGVLAETGDLAAAFEVSQEALRVNRPTEGHGPAVNRSALLARAKSGA